MIIRPLHQSGARRAVAVFLGWGMDTSPFTALRKDGYDIFALYDYRSPLADIAPLRQYDELCVVAWSWGVPAAARFISDYAEELRITGTVAVNGTLTPVHPLTGIPPAIFEGTRRGLSEVSLRKFRRRMCASAGEFAAFSACAPQRPLPELAQELDALAGEALPPEAARLFDSVVVSASDLIIPTAAQLRAWEGHPGLVRIEGAHLPDLQYILDRFVRDKQLVGSRFAASAASYDGEAVMQHRISALALDMLRPALTPSVSSVLEIGAGTGFFTSLYAPLLGAGCCLRRVDLAPLEPDVEEADGELLPFTLPQEGFDLVVSTSAIQWFNSPRRFLQRVQRLLRPGGTAVITGFAPGHFAELTPFLPAPLRYLHPSEVPAPWEAHALELRQDFPSPAALLHHLRATGVNALTPAKGSSPVAAARAVMASGITSLTHKPLFLRLRKS